MLRAPWLAPVLLFVGGCPGVLSGGRPGSTSEQGIVPWQDGVVVGLEAGGDSGPAPDVPPGADQMPAPDGMSPTGVWQPKPGTTWHWQLTGTVDQSVDAKMYDIDLFNNDAATITAIKAQGRVVICYFSAGSYEDWRPDAGDFPQAALGSKMEGWDEQWVDIRSSGLRDVMKKRLDLAQSKGCDGVEPDNVDGFANSTGFSLTASDQLDYNRFLASEAHKRGLSVGLKNDLDQVSQLEPYFDWALNEECLQYSECGQLSPFIQAGKAVFHVEYSPASKNSVCPQVTPLKFDSQIKKLDLDAWFVACWS